MPFWDGSGQAALLKAWRESCWSDDWGTVSSADRYNGSSGDALVKGWLEPLGIDSGDSWCTDCLDRYHQSVDMRRAINDVYVPFAEGDPRLRGRLPQLPKHPSTHAIVEGADHARLDDEIRTAQPEIVITLGEAALKVFRSLVSASEPDGLHSDERYGSEVRFRSGGRGIVWYPLIHPGQKRSPWRPAHDLWARRFLDRGR